jgi:hypothetical protein
MYTAERMIIGDETNYAIDVQECEVFLHRECMMNLNEVEMGFMEVGLHRCVVERRITLAIRK